MKEYELTVLIHPDLEVDIDAPLTKIRGIITSAGGSIISEDIWGKKGKGQGGPQCDKQK